MDKKNLELFVKLVGHILTGAALCAVMGGVDFGLFALGNFMESHGMVGIELALVHIPAWALGISDSVVFVAWTVKGSWEFVRELFK